MTATQPRTARPTPSVYAELEQIAENAQTFNRLVTTNAKIAQTPKELVWTLNKAKLYRYVPVVPEEKRHKHPAAAGLRDHEPAARARPAARATASSSTCSSTATTSTCSTGARPGPRTGTSSSTTTRWSICRAPSASSSRSPAPSEFSMLGWCLGALISTLYAALRPDDGLKNLILLTAPLDFTDKTAGGFIRWTSDQAFNADKLVETFGNVPGELIDYGAKALKPVENYIGSYLNLWDNIDNPKVVESWHAMNTWVRDIIPMAGAAYRQLINEFYKENRLMEGTLTIRGERVDLSKLRANLLNVIAETDHITPPCQSEGMMGAGRQPGQGGVPGARRPYRDHGRQRRREAHLAAHRGLAGHPV